MYIPSFFTMSLMALASARPSSPSPRGETKAPPCIPTHNTLCGSPELLVDPKDFPIDRFVILDFDTEPGYFRPSIKQIPIEFSKRPQESLNVNASSISFSKDALKDLGPDEHILCQVFHDHELASTGGLSKAGEVLPLTQNKWTTVPVWGVYCVKNGGIGF